MSGLTIRALREGVEEAIRHCTQSGEAPVAFVLHKFVDVSDEELADYLKKGERAARGEIPKNQFTMEKFRIARRWEEFKTFYWLTLAQKEPKNASFAMFNLKQGEGADREGRDGKTTVIIRLDGVGGEEGMR